jgi:hypothetical protein
VSRLGPTGAAESILELGLGFDSTVIGGASCATVRLSSALAGVVASANRTVPFDGTEIAVTLNAELEPLASKGAWTPMRVVLLRAAGVVTGGGAGISSTRMVKKPPKGSLRRTKHLFDELRQEPRLGRS